MNRWNLPPANREVGIPTAMDTAMGEVITIIPPERVTLDG